METEKQFEDLFYLKVKYFVQKNYKEPTHCLMDISYYHELESKSNKFKNHIINFQIYNNGKLTVAGIPIILCYKDEIENNFELIIM